MCSVCLREPAVASDPIPQDLLEPDERADIDAGKPWPLISRCATCRRYWLRSGKTADRRVASIERHQRQRDRDAVCRLLGIEQKPKRRPGRKPWWMQAKPSIRAG